MNKPNRFEKPVRILRGRVQSPEEGPAFAVGGLTVALKDSPATVTQTDAEGRFAFVGYELPGAAAVSVRRGDAIVGFGDIGGASLPIVVEPQKSTPIVGGDEVVGPLLGTDWAVLTTALARVDAAHAETIQRGCAELALLDATAVGVLDGSQDPEAFLELIAEEARWNAKGPARRSAARPDSIGLALQSPGAPVLLSLLLDPSPEGPAAQAITGYLRRAEPILRLVAAARLVVADRATPDTFAAVAEWAAMLLDGPLPVSELVTILRAPSPLLPPPGNDGPPPLPPRRGRFEWLDPRNAEWLNCVGQLGKAVPPPEARRSPGDLFTVSPTAICVSEAASPVTLTLTADAGSTFAEFGDRQEWTIGVGSGNVTSVEPSADRRTVTVVVEGLTGGCHPVGWVLTSGWAPSDGDPLGPGCRQALRLPTWSYRGWQLGTQPSLRNQSQLSVIDPVVDRLWCDPASPAEACTSVAIFWSASVDVCADALALVTTSLHRDDGAVVGTDLPLRGNLVDVDEWDRNHQYELRIATKNSSGADCAVVRSPTLMLERIKQVHLNLPVLPDVIGEGKTVQGTVRISCPAPADVIVTLSASPVAIIGGIGLPATVTIPAGEVQAPFVASGLSYGSVEVTGSAPGHADGTISCCVARAPLIDPAATPIPEVAGCAALSISVPVTSVSPALVASITGSSFVGARVLGASVGRTAPCVGDAMVTLNGASLPRGSYILTLTDIGGVSRYPFVVAPRPRIISVTAPPVPAAPTANYSVVTVTVTGADSVEVTAARSAQAVSVDRPSNIGECGTWIAQISIAVACPEDQLTVVAIAGVVRSTPESVTATVYASVSAGPNRTDDGYAVTVTPC